VSRAALVGGPGERVYAVEARGTARDVRCGPASARLPTRHHQLPQMVQEVRRAQFTDHRPWVKWTFTRHCFRCCTSSPARMSTTSKACCHLAMAGRSFRDIPRRWEARESLCRRTNHGIVVLSAVPSPSLPSPGVHARGTSLRLRRGVRLTAHWVRCRTRVPPRHVSASRSATEVRIHVVPHLAAPPRTYRVGRTAASTSQNRSTLKYYQFHWLVLPAE